jgi:hypothetical protein
MVVAMPRDRAAARRTSMRFKIRQITLYGEYSLSPHIMGGIPMNANEPHRIGRKSTPVDRRAARIAAAEQSLASAYASIRAAGVDPDSIATAFAVARDCLAEATELSAQARRDLALAQYERDLARCQEPAAYPSAEAPDSAVLTPCPVPVPSDAAQPGDTGPRPDPGAARTPEEFMDALRGFRGWAGKPSFRAMERQCARRFAASTICTALRADTLPSLDMVHAIVTGCGGSPRHVHAFATAWRRLTPHPAAPGHDTPGQQDTARQWRDRPRGLYSVGGTAAPARSAQVADQGR